MKKVNVIGSTGSGKSSFSRKLAHRLEVPYIEMDAIHWQPNWRELDTPTFRARVTKVLQQPAFVLDGNYSKIEDIKWAEVDTTVWLDLGFWTTFCQIASRSIKRAVSRDEIWKGSGYKETLSGNFLSSDSVVLWMLKTYHRNKTKYKRLFDSDAVSHIKLIHIRSHYEAECFLATVG